MRKLCAVLTGLMVALTLGACEISDDITGSEGAANVAQRANLASGFDPAGSATYEVKITNLTSGQPLTPPLAAVHRRPVDLFSVGEVASFQLKEIAENGNLDPMLMRLEGEKHVNEVVVAAGSPPPLLPGESISFQLEVERGARYLSFVSMLICTNDGFTGVDAHKLPKSVSESTILHSEGYDAGTEINTEDFADLVPPCPVLTGVPSNDSGTGTSDPALAEGGVIRHHPGIQGVGDLDPAIHAWTDPVAKIEIVRVQ